MQGHVDYVVIYPKGNEKQRKGFKNNFYCKEFGLSLSLVPGK